MVDVWTMIFQKPHPQLIQGSHQRIWFSHPFRLFQGCHTFNRSQGWCGGRTRRTRRTCNSFQAKDILEVKMPSPRGLGWRGMLWMDGRCEFQPTSFSTPWRCWRLKTSTKKNKRTRSFQAQFFEDWKRTHRFWQKWENAQKENHVRPWSTSKWMTRDERSKVEKEKIQ